MLFPSGSRTGEKAFFLTSDAVDLRGVAAPAGCALSDDGIRRAGEGAGSPTPTLATFAGEGFGAGLAAGANELRVEAVVVAGLELSGLPLIFFWIGIQ